MRARRAGRRRRSWRGVWHRANRRRRIAMVGGGLVSVLCVLALIASLIWFVRWSVEINQARLRQSEFAATYDFDPGDIISDSQFFNQNAMSRDEVQAFLNDHGGTCTGAQCLKSITVDTESQAANDQCAAYEGASGESAAAIIDKSARACGISQKVLLTMLQKEQHLVSASQPSAFQFKAAMGLSCPDDADCDPTYAGFFRQVYGAAKRYQYYRSHQEQYGYRARALNYVRYHPNAACGGDTIYIENDATALLYIYTPYQPNIAALQAGAGTGDQCSSYGNRNFSLIYEGWFGNSRQ